MTGAGRHLLLRASAGTGKTYQLVQTYLELVTAEDLRPAEIVAITFTRKAALELEGRIRGALRDRGVSRDVLAELARAPVSNFHGLALQLLSAAGLSGGGLGAGTTVLGEGGEDERLFVEACEEAWLGTASEVRAAVEALAPSFDVGGALPGQLWAALSRAREDGAALGGAALVGTYDAGALRDRLSRRLEEVRSRLREAAPALSATSRAKLDAALACMPDPGAALDDLAWAEAWSRARARLDRRGALGKLLDESDLPLMAEARDLVVAELACAEAAPHLARLVDAAWRRYGELKAERRALDFGDLVERAVALLETDRDAHADVRRRFRAVLVDEAQDTNRLQRRFVHLLAGLAGPAAASAPPASLVVVGDRKQSIYTFRGADPESFAAFAGDVAALGGEERTLEASWRSTAAVCDAVNHLGERLFGPGYEPIHPAHTGDRGPTPRWIETPAADDSAAAVLAEARAVAALVASRVAAGEPPDRFVLLLAALSRAPVYSAALLAAGVPAVVGGGVGLYARREITDLAALVGWAADREDRLAAAVALRSPIFGLSDGGLFRLLGPGSGDAFVRLGRGALGVHSFAAGDGSRGSAGPETLSAGDASASAAAGPASPAPESLAASDADALALVGRVMPRLWRAAALMPPADLLALAFELTGYEAVLAALPGGEQRLASARHLIAVAEAFSAREGPDARRFARELAFRIDGGAREPLAPGAGGGAVTIGTVHQAKGLEFPVVLLADLAHRGRGETGVLRYSRGEGLLLRPRRSGDLLSTDSWREADRIARGVEDEERRRLLYVAVTRAERELLFFAPAKVREARAGFHGLLRPWRDAAVTAGVLEVESVAEPGEAAPTGEAGAGVEQTTGAGAAERDEEGGERGAGEREAGEREGDEREAGEREAGHEPRVAAARQGTGDAWAEQLVSELASAPLPDESRFELAVTELETYLQCLRRGALRSLFRLDEPGFPWTRPERDDVDPPLDALARGRIAHGVLAQLDGITLERGVDAFVRDGVAGLGYDPADPRLGTVVADTARFLSSPLGRRIAAMPPERRRHELPFRLVVGAAPYEVAIAGQIDLLYEDDDGPVIVDFKLARYSPEAVTSYRLQLAIYAVAVARLQGEEGQIRTVLAFLKDGRVVQGELGPAERRSLEARIAAVGRDLAAVQRSRESWPRQPAETCRALGCGFVRACHGPETGAPGEAGRREVEAVGER